MTDSYYRRDLAPTEQIVPATADSAIYPRDYQSFHAHRSSLQEAEQSLVGNASRNLASQFDGSNGPEFFDSKGSLPSDGGNEPQADESAGKEYRESKQRFGEASETLAQRSYRNEDERRRADQERWSAGLTADDFKEKEQRNGWTEYPKAHTDAFKSIMAGKNIHDAATSTEMVSHIAKILSADGDRTARFGSNSREYQDVRSAFALAFEAGKQKEFTDAINAQMEKLTGSKITQLAVSRESHNLLLFKVDEDLLRMGHKSQSGAVEHSTLLVRKWVR